MELLIKLYSDKPSRLAIKYTYEYLAVKDYENLIHRYGSGNFRAELEFHKDRIHLSLISETSGTRLTYKDLEFKMEQLKRLQAIYTPDLNLLFVHVFPKSNTLLVAKPFRREQFPTVTDLNFIGIPGAMYQ